MGVVAALSFEESYRILESGAGWFCPAGESVIRLFGADATEWLQGQATNDVLGVPVGGSMEFCFCTVTGQISAACVGWRREWGWVIVTAAGQAVLERAEQMVIMEDVSAEEITSSVSLVSVQGPVASAPGGFAHDRCGFGGYDVLSGPPDGLPELDPVAVEVAALEAGLPRVGVDYGAKTFPPELGSVFEARNVSYRKGCYTGQEVLMRIHSRGHTNKTWCGLLLSGALEPGTYEGIAVTRVAHSLRFGWIGAATLSNAQAQEGAVLDLGGVRAEVQLFPFRRD